MSGATDILEQVYVWLPAGFLLDFLVVGTLAAFARRRYRLRAAARSPEDALPGDRT
jgi:hypothetical protein